MHGGRSLSNPWRTLSRRDIYRNQWLSVREDRIERPRSGEGIYSVVDRADSLAVIPRDEDGDVVLVRQFRYPVQRLSWEIPSGTLEPGEAPFAAAARELVEETGVTADRWSPVGSFWLAPGFCSQVCHVWLAEGLTFGPLRPDPTEEDLVVGRFAPAEIEAMVRAGELMDGLTISALALLRLND